MWCPHVTVATIVERDNRYLMVHEHTDVGQVFNQPAGHLDANETLIAAAERETFEETGWKVAITHLLGSSVYLAPNGLTYVRFTFIATPIKHYPLAPLDKEIIEAVWLSFEELTALQNQLRSPLVFNDIQRYRQSIRYPLTFLNHFFIGE